VTAPASAPPVDKIDEEDGDEETTEDPDAELEQFEHEFSAQQACDL
jgi:hypothetical protein